MVSSDHLRYLPKPGPTSEPVTLRNARVCITFPLSSVNPFLPSARYRENLDSSVNNTCLQRRMQNRLGLCLFNQFILTFLRWRIRTNQTYGLRALMPPSLKRFRTVFAHILTTDCSCSLLGSLKAISQVCKANLPVLTPRCCPWTTTSQAILYTCSVF